MKQDADQRLTFKHSLNGKMWADIEMKNQPSNVRDLRPLSVCSRQLDPCGMKAVHCGSRQMFDEMISKVGIRFT
jgi:hypothetical protein